MIKHYYNKRRANLFLGLIWIGGMLAIGCSLQSCDSNVFSKGSKVDNDNYDSFKNVVLYNPVSYLSDTTNVFDKSDFDPSKDSISEVVDSFQNVLSRDSMAVQQVGINDSGILTSSVIKDSSISPNNSFSNDIGKIATEEIKSLKYNLEISRQPTLAANSSCKRNQCKVFAYISKSKQRLYLYVDGVVVDTFKVSTGDKKHETPKFDTRPNGLMFKKYTSKKFPGGNYQGLGNMPYVVFIKGGYGIHGTTLGNIKKLGTKASHGCIRLHPDNGKIFFELVKSVGAENTWITVADE